MQDPESGWRLPILTFCVCVFFTSASYTMVVPFLPLYLLELGAGSDLAFWNSVVFAVSFLVGGMMAPIWGRLSDRMGPQTMAMRSALLLTAAYMLGAVVETPFQLFLMRVLQGFANGYLPAVLALTSMLTPEKRLGSGLAWVQSAQLSGTVSGPLIGGLLAGLCGYRASFVLAGMLLLSICAITLWAVRSPRCALKSRTQTATPIADSSLLGDFRFFLGLAEVRRIFTLAFLIFTVKLGILPIITLFVTELAPEADNLTLLSGLACSLPPLIGAFSAPWWGRFGQGHGFYLALTLGLFGTGVFLIAQGFAPTLTIFLILAALMGFFESALIPALNAALVLAIPRDHRGRAFGMMTLVNQFGSMSGPLVGGLVITILALPAQFCLSGCIFLGAAAFTLRVCRRVAAPRHQE